MKILLIAFLGAAVGSFLGVVINRFPHQSILFPASHCNHCKTPLKPWDLIPIVSQIWRKSRCAYCQAKIPIWYAVIELAMALIFLAVYGKILTILEALLLTCGLVLAIYDIKHREYPLVIWLVFAFLACCISGFTLFFFVFIGLAIIAEYFPLRIGAGDFLYLALLALRFSHTQLLWVIQISCLVALICVWIAKKKNPRIPLVPFLVVGFLAVGLGSSLG